MMRMSVKKKMVDGVVYFILALLSVVWLIPLLWLVLQAFSNDPGTYTAYFFPKSYTFNNFIQLFADNSRLDFGRWFLNTVIVAFATCFVSTMLVLMVSYALSRLKFRFRKAFLNIALIMGMFPGFMSMVAIYYIIKVMELGQTLFALVLAYSGAAGLGFYIVKGFFDTIPYAIDEAAMIDGANRHQIFYKITLPLSKPIIVYTILTSFLAPWFDFIFISVLMAGRDENYNVAYGLYIMLDRTNFTEYFKRFFAGATLVSVIISTLFIILQRYYVQGITGGAAKG